MYDYWDIINCWEFKNLLSGHRKKIKRKLLTEFEDNLKLAQPASFFEFIGSVFCKQVLNSTYFDYEICWSPWGNSWTILIRWRQTWMIWWHPYRLYRGELACRSWNTQPRSDQSCQPWLRLGSSTCHHRRQRRNCTSLARWCSFWDESWHPLASHLVAGLPWQL